MKDEQNVTIGRRTSIFCYIQTKSEKEHELQHIARFYKI